jgi:hypothetical protein
MPLMGLLATLNHLLNFVAPALWVALLVPVAARVFIKNNAVALSLYAQAAINFIVSVVALALGLWFFGRDGKMATYAAMALSSASAQWGLQRGWKT